MSRLILFLENYTAGGSDIVAKMLILHLNVEKIHLFLNKRFDKSILFSEKIPNNVEIIYYNLITPGEIGRFANRWQRYFLIYIAIKIIDYVFRYPLMLFSVFYFYFKFKKINASHLLAINGGYPGSQFCRTAIFAASFLNHIQLFHIHHSIPVKPHFVVRYFEFLLDRLLESKCQMLSVSMCTARLLMEKRNFSKMPIHIHNGLPLKKMKLHDNHSSLKLLHVGYFDYIKNHEMLIRCLIKLSEMGYNEIELTLVGKIVDQSIYDNIIALVKFYRLEEKVIFAGFKNDVFPYYYANDILLLSSVIEALPIVVLEAMSVGMPIISTNVGGVSEQIVDGITGYLVHVNDVEDMTSKILKFYKHPEIISIMGEQGFECFQRKFTLQKMIADYQKVMQL